LSTNDRVKIIDDESESGYYELVIPDVTQEDAGRYSCVAMNDYGEEKCEAQLSVTGTETFFFSFLKVSPREQCCQISPFRQI